MRRPGHRRITSLAPQTQAFLDDVRALTGSPDARVRRAAWQNQVKLWRRELLARGYVALRGLLPPILLAAVSEYYRLLDAEGYLPSGDLRRAGDLLNDEPLLCVLGRKLSSVVRQVTGERVPWTSSYLRVCGPGATLDPHRDMPVCRWNLDLVVGGEPTPERESAWPLWVHQKGRATPVRLGLGDGLLYRGTQLRHSRKPQPASHKTLLAALHYGLPARRRSSAPIGTPRA